MSVDELNMIMDDNNDNDGNHDAHHIWISLKNMYGACNDDQDHRASIQEEPTTTDQSFSSQLIHHGFTAKDDEEIESKREGVVSGFEANKEPFRGKQVENNSMEECSASKSCTDPSVIPFKTQEQKKGKIGDTQPIGPTRFTNRSDRFSQAECSEEYEVF